MTSPDLIPHHWLHALVARLRDHWTGAPVEGAVSGAGWVSVRIGGEFLWLHAAHGKRLAWISERPFPRKTLEMLGRHARSPFASHLRDLVVENAHVLLDPEGACDGFVLVMGPAPRRRLHFRVFPRPGAIWLDTEAGEDLARLGRMEGAELSPADPTDDPDFDLASHAAACRRALDVRLRDQAHRTLQQQLERRAKKLQRLIWTLEGDSERAAAELGARQLADLLAAHLHQVRPGMPEVTVDDFDGHPRTLELDPALPPSVNLERWYKKAAKAERAIRQVHERLENSRTEFDAIASQSKELSALSTEATIEDWIAFADRHGLDVVPKAPRPASERGKPDAERLPYWVYRIGEWEIRVGRSARDNDQLTARHAHNRDLWLHAQGVAGSHVVIRCAGKPVPRDVVEDAARLAAHFSRAKTSATVPVLLVEKRYVRKPRKAAPGMVSVERAKTLFVEPGIAARCERVEGD